MLKKNPVLTYSVIASLISLGLSMITSRLQIISFINHLFMIGITLLMVAGLIYVIQGGFFHVFGLGFRKIWKTSSQKLGIDDDLDEKVEDEELKAGRKEFMSQIGLVCFIVGILCLLLSTALVYKI